MKKYFIMYIIESKYLYILIYTYIYTKNLYKFYRK